MASAADPQVLVILGAQWGDEGKGKIVDHLSENLDVVVRASGGANAGHTIYVKGEKHVFHLVPSGVLHEQVVCVIGNGCVVHLPTLLDEMNILRKAGFDLHGRILISDRAHLVFEHHIQADMAQEKHRTKKIGTTCRGIGPAYEDKVSRRGIRAGEMVSDFSKFAEKLKANAQWRMKRHDFEMDITDELNTYRNLADEFAPMITDTLGYLHDVIDEKKKLLIEGAQGVHLDIDFGTYPFVTSSSTATAGVCTGTGIPPNKIDAVIGVLKAYTTRVGEGPFPSELMDETGELLRERGGEYGATTGRPRRCGWFDAVVAKHTARVAGITGWNITKLDVLSGMESLKILTEYTLNGEPLKSLPADAALLYDIEKQFIEMPGWNEDISKCRSFSDLPKNAQKYCRELETITGVKIHSIGVGPNRDDMILL
jgi:adenylosuccinate synthase